jgi:serine/threonine protein kinase
LKNLFHIISTKSEKKNEMTESFISKLLEFGYKYINEIGRRDFAMIHLIFSEKYDKYFTLKQSVQSSNFEFDHEIEILKQLIHPNIINLYSVIQIKSFQCAVLDYCPGGTLEDLINAYGSIKPPRLYKYCFQILSAIGYLHQNKIAHRDIKPSNILLDANDKIKITDFGLSEKITSKSKTIFAGSGTFASPEILKKVDGYDPLSADIYSLGVTFCYMSQGRYISPILFEDFAFQDFDIFMKNIDSNFCKLVFQMMKKNPKKRPSVSELLCNPMFDIHKTKHTHKIPSIHLKNKIQIMKIRSIHYD